MVYSFLLVTKRTMSLQSSTPPLSAMTLHHLLFAAMVREMYFVGFYREEW
jgi:hypothetical protein